MTKHKRDCRRLCEHAGLSVTGIEHRGSGHLAINTDRGMLIFPSTPSSRRWRVNMEAQVRRISR